MHRMEEIPEHDRAHEIMSQYVSANVGLGMGVSLTLSSSPV